MNEEWKYCPYDGAIIGGAGKACSKCERIRSNSEQEPIKKAKWEKVLYKKQVRYIVNIIRITQIII